MLNQDSEIVPESDTKHWKGKRDMTYDAMRKAIYDTTMMLYEKDLIRLSAGNVSLHDGEGHIAITPSGLWYDRMTPQDIPIVDLQRNLVDGQRAPSSETPMHTAMYRAFPEVGGIVHTHSVNAIAFAMTGCELPVVCLELFAVGGPVPVAPFVCPGTNDVGEVAVRMLTAQPGLKCLLLRNHGLVAIGASLDNAFENACQFEIGAEAFFRGLQVGSPTSLTEAQIEEIKQRTLTS
jgi:L-fuculose-phosphate aldolase